MVTSKKRIRQMFIIIVFVALSSCAGTPREPRQPFYHFDTSEFATVSDVLDHYKLPFADRSVCGKNSSEGSPTNIPGKVFVVSGVSTKAEDFVKYLGDEKFTVIPSDAKSIMFMIPAIKADNTRTYRYVPTGSPTGGPVFNPTPITVKHTPLGIGFCFVDLEKGIYFGHTTYAGGMPEYINREEIPAYTSDNYRPLVKSFIVDVMTVSE